MKKNYSALAFEMQIKRRMSTELPETHYIFRTIILTPSIIRPAVWKQYVSDDWKFR